MKRFGHSGDLGDIVQFLPIVQQLGGKHSVWLYNQPFTKVIEARFGLIAPLLMAQPYVEVVGIGKPQDMDYDVSQFRHRYVHTRTLLASQAEWCNRQYGLPIPRGEDAWLTVKPRKGLKDRIIVARSSRYHNDLFPWKRVVEHYGTRLLFVGLPEEHADFCARFGKVEYLPTADLLETAQAIAGSALFIGNQSSPNSVAEGLKHPRIQETSLRVPDCIFPGTGAQYVADGEVLLPQVGDTPELHIESTLNGFRPLDTTVTPPGGWRYDGLTPQLSFPVQVAAVARTLGVAKDEATTILYEANCLRAPGFFKRTDGEARLTNFRKALNNV